MHKTLAIVVTYNPDITHLKKLIGTLTSQVDALLVIDNNSANFNPQIVDDFPPKTEVILNRQNLGLATAYNQGCSIARERGFTHVILFDQDSLPAHDMVTALYAAMCLYNGDTLKVAAAGPKYKDIKGQKLSPFVRIKDFHLERVPCADNEVVDVDHLISSGSLIDLRALEITGNFADDLFIDCVDTEWCLRVRHHNLRILGIGNAFMDHSIGEKYLHLFGRQLPMHTPLRLRYQFRNQIWIIRQSWVGWRWRVIDSIRCLKLVVVYLFFAPNKRSNLLAISNGIIDGISNKMGKI